jgi:thiopeptide-type bacteriocin biosynthesis protein
VPKVLIPSKPSRVQSLPATLYEPLEFFQIRAPLLPIEAYLGLGKTGIFANLDFGAAASDSDGPAAKPPEPISGSVMLPSLPPLIRRALAVGSLSLLGALDRPAASSAAEDRVRSRLVRYLIRMSTRPTPFGLFAGVALGYWGSSTDVRIEPAIRTRTRPDMAWLMSLVLRLESRPEVRGQLKVFANTAALIHSGRVFLAERAPTLDTHSAGAVSVRATDVVKRVLREAREPIPWQELADRIVTNSPGATPEKAEKLLNELWEQTLILTDLRPPLTHDNPARYVADRLAGIAAADEARSQLKSVLSMASDWDAGAGPNSVESYNGMVAKLQVGNQPQSEPALQVDATLCLSGARIARAVGEEVARAAELLLRMTPSPLGLSHIEVYRRSFEARYSHGREIPLLELLDPGLGLGPPTAYITGQYPPSGGISARDSMARSQALLNLACRALRDGRTSVELDPDALKRLETCSPSRLDAPTSLDLYTFVAARSAEAVDRGEFKVVLGPNLGATAAGRSLGRFADMIGPEARTALEAVAQAEEKRAPANLYAELVYQPRWLRSANVVVRPVVRQYEIVWGTTPGVPPDHVIPIHELVIGVRAGRFYVRWPATGADVVVCSGHMLNNLRAPVVCRLLADLSRDRQVQLNAFTWGPASNFPFLPRVEVGRVVLRPARWRIDAVTRASQLLYDEPARFPDALTIWRAAWSVPRYVYLSSSDNRLLLDLDSPAQADELRLALRATRENGSVTLEEAFPSLEEAWVEGPAGHYMAELVVSVVLRKRPLAADNNRLAAHAKAGRSIIQGGSPSLESAPIETTTAGPAAARPDDSRLRPPGSEWLFLKLYCNRDVEEDLIAGPARRLGEQLIESGAAKEWFFLRYSDPDRHLRIRFRGDAERLAHQVIPQVCAWATDLMSQGSCLRFTFDTYERELERYGGPGGAAVAEGVFCADSRAVAQILDLIQSRRLQLDRTNVAVLTVDTLLAGLELSEAARLEWYRNQLWSRRDASVDYRNRKVLLRRLIADTRWLRAEPGGEDLYRSLAARREQLRPLTERLKTLKASRELTQPLSTFYASLVHLHLNRIGIDRNTERNIVGLLWRVRQSLACAPLFPPGA